jgi:hypothetical protein
MSNLKGAFQAFNTRKTRFSDCFFLFLLYPLLRTYVNAGNLKRALGSYFTNPTPPLPHSQLTDARKIYITRGHSVFKF